MVRELLRRSRPIVARVTFAELAAGLARAAREAVIDDAQRDAVLARLDVDFSEFTVIEIKKAMLRRVPELVVRHPLRGFDAVQLAAALLARHEGTAISFWSADANLVAAARAEGLRGVVPSG